MRSLWSTNVGCPLRGLALARETGRLLAWDAHNNLHLFEPNGSLHERRPALGPLVAIGAADDGSGFAAAATDGTVWLLGPDLAPRWDRRLPRPAVAVAIDSFGQRVAAADAGGNLQVFDTRGSALETTNHPRPLRFLAFVPEEPRLVAAADLGLVACFDAAGKPTWRDGLAAHVSALTTSGDGSRIALACLGAELLVYALAGPPHRPLPQPYPCRLAALSYDGATLLSTDLGTRLVVSDASGKVRAELHLSIAPAAIALAPLADCAIVALPDGSLQAFELPGRG